MASRLIHKATYEADNPFDVSLTESFQLLEPQLRPPFPLTILTQSEYSNLNRAILYGILCEPHLAEVHIKHLHGIVIDGYSLFTALLTRLVDELYSKLVENVKIQLLGVTSIMIRVSAIGIDGLLVALLRQTRGANLVKQICGCVMNWLLFSPLNGIVCWKKSHWCYQALCMSFLGSWLITVEFPQTQI